MLPPQIANVSFGCGVRRPRALCGRIPCLSPCLLVREFPYLLAENPGALTRRVGAYPSSLPGGCLFLRANRTPSKPNEGRTSPVARFRGKCPTDRRSSRCAAVLARIGCLNRTAFVASKLRIEALLDLRSSGWVLDVRQKHAFAQMARQESDPRIESGSHVQGSMCPVGYRYNIHWNFFKTVSLLFSTDNDELSTKQIFCQDSPDC